MRSIEMHSWPELLKQARIIASTVRVEVGVGAHDRGVLAAELEAEQPLSRAAARAATSRPVRVEPVKQT